MDVQLSTPYSSDMFEKLALQMPPGFQVYQAKPVFGKSQSLSAVINLACYDVTLPMDAARASELAEELLSKESVIATRKTKTDIIEVDIRPGIFDVEISEMDGECCLVKLTTGLGNLSFARPSEVVENGFGLSAEEVLKLDVKRTDLLIRREDKRLTPFEII